MTDLQIEKGIECCVGDCPDCKHCPYFDDEDCCVTLSKDTREYVKRKKEEREQIRKDTAKEILQHFMTLPTCKHPTIATGNFTLGKNYIRELAQKYGVEVDE